MSITTGLVPIDEAVYFDICTHTPSTGAVTDADATPTFDVYEEATDTGLLGATNFTKRTSLTGDYRGTFTASAANGFEAGKWYSVIASATVGGIAAKKNCGSFRVAPAEAVAGVPKVDVDDWKGATAPAMTGDSFARLGAPAGASVSVDVAAIQAKTTNLPGSPAAVGSAMTLTSGERTSVADAMLDEANGVETSLTVRQALRIALASLAGKLSGAATTTVTIRNVGDTKARITATVDSDGNRSTVTTDGT